MRERELIFFLRTPQNTPANNAPISSHAQQPGVASIKEGVYFLLPVSENHCDLPIWTQHDADNNEEDLDRATAAAIFAQNPKVVSMIQDRLSSLVGRSSGYIESLPASVRRRVTGLKGVQKEHTKLEIAFQEEVQELEKKYATKFNPLYEKRAKIITGAAEPTEEEVKAGEQEDDEDNDKVTQADSAEEEPQGENLTGIPEFWLSAMKNHPSVAELITDRDEAALKHLTDIRMEFLEKPGFRLVFEFAENEFFTNKLITKTYIFQEEISYGGEFMYDRAEGDKIDWKTGKNLSVRIESKKQRNKSKFLGFLSRNLLTVY